MVDSQQYCVCVKGGGVLYDHLMNMIISALIMREDISVSSQKYEANGTCSIC